jgi:enterochelin esterase family protein
MKRKLLSLALLFAASAAISYMALSQTPPPPLVSPDVHPDNTVTFHFRAPNAKEVTVQIEGSAKPVPMQKDDQGVWSVTAGPLTPDYYGYSFIADGVGLLDPSNYRTKPNFLYRANEVHVPGPSLSWETSDVAQGEIHHHFYKSSIVDDYREFFVYILLSLASCDRPLPITSIMCGS